MKVNAKVNAVAQYVVWTLQRTDEVAHPLLVVIGADCVLGHNNRTVQE